MLPGMNPKDIEKAMKRMGIKQEQIDASEVIIKTKNKQLTIKQPNVVKVNMMGQETFQITGKVQESSLEKFTEDDIETVMEQTNCSKEQAKKALKKNNGDLAKTIISLKQ